MKHAKKVLFLMVVSTSLSMFGMDENVVTTSPASPVSLKKSELHIDLNASCQNPYACKAKKLAITSSLLGLTTGLSFVAQAYDKSGVTRDPKFVKAQYTALAATATTAVLAAQQAHKAHPEFVNNAVDTTTTSVQNAATYLKNLCTSTKADDVQ